MAKVGIVSEPGKNSKDEPTPFPLTGRGKSPGGKLFIRNLSRERKLSIRKTTLSNLEKKEGAPLLLPLSLVAGFDPQRVPAPGVALTKRDHLLMKERFCHLLLEFPRIRKEMDPAPQSDPSQKEI
jgi:hypothetical protein